MNAAELIHEAKARGIELWAEGSALRYRGNPESIGVLLPELKAHKPELLRLLAGEPAELHQGNPAPMPHPEEENSPTGTVNGYDATDDRRACRDCLNLSAGRCLAAQRGEIIASRTYRPDTDRLRRCSGYRPSVDDADRRTGRERWPGLPDRLTRGTWEGAA
jgi:hypothetical protein